MNPLSAAIALLALLCVPQDDFSPLIERLGSDSVQERDAAARELERQGPDALERLEKAMGAARDIEVKSRLGQIVRNIRKEAEFSKVFGPTKRVSLDVKDQPAADVLLAIGKSLGVKIECDGLDPKKPLSLRLSGATMWEALDVLGKVADARCEYEGWGEKIHVRPGAAPALPVLYLEQFRVGVAELQRIGHRSPNLRDSAAMIVLEIRHQPNMHPVNDHFAKRFQLDQLIDSKGNNAAASSPRWGGSICLNPRPYALQEAFFVRADAAGALTLAGTVHLTFAMGEKELTLPMQGAVRELREGNSLIKVSGFSQTAAGTSLTLTAESVDGEDPNSRLKDSSITLYTEDGEKHVSRSMSGGGGGGSWSWEFQFPKNLKKPDRIAFRWVAEMKQVEIPFRFEGVVLPNP